VVHIPTRALVTACALSAALLVAGCGGDSDKDKAAGGSTGDEVFLEPVAAQGPDPFTDSTVTSTAAPPPVTRTPQPTSTGGASDTRGVRSFSGATPGLYGGTQNVGSCDVEKQIRFLAADRSKARAFAQASGISQASIPAYLRALTSVVLRADTRVTNHGFSDGRATGFQSVLQAGTAVLIDTRGVPRVRCACGNPVDAPAASQQSPRSQGRSWSGYRPTEVIVVTPAPTAITNITIINTVDNTWIERPVGHDGHHHDHAVPPPDDWTQMPRPHEDESSPHPHDSSPRPHDSSSSASPSKESPRPDGSASDCATPHSTVTVTPGATQSAPDQSPGSQRLADASSRCPAATVPAPPEGSLAPSGRSTPPGTGTTTPGRSPSEEPSLPPDSSSGSSPSSEDIGPDTVPDSPDLPDGGGRIPDEPTVPDSIFDSPTDVFDS
jgi:hypothetical protein